MELRVTSVAGGGCQFGEMRFNEAQTKPVARHTCLINAGVMFIRPSQRAYVSLSAY